MPTDRPTLPLYGPMDNSPEADLVGAVRKRMEPADALRGIVLGAAKFIPGATQGHVHVVADRVAKWLGQAGCVVVNRDDLWLVVDAYERRLTPNVAADEAAAQLRTAARFPRLDATSDDG